VKDTISTSRSGGRLSSFWFFGVERFLVPRGVVNTSAKGAARTYLRIVSKNALLCYSFSSAEGR
jgi:hypothetical protein